MEGNPDDIEVSDRAKEQAEVTGAEELQKKIDEGVEAALNLDGVTFEEAKRAFRTSRKPGTEPTLARTARLNCRLRAGGAVGDEAVKARFFNQSEHVDTRKER